jgi:phosphoglycerate dehydrogenase-like enzyme/predicted dehydrogenase
MPAGRTIMTTVGRKQPLRALVVGAGPAAIEMHLPVLARLRDQGELRLQLVCDLQFGRADAARRRFGFAEQTGDGVSATARTDIDVVYVFASAQVHYALGLAALGAGKHLFVEKPIAPTYQAAQKLARVARQRGLIAAGGHNRRFFESLAAARARAGKTGWQFAEALFHKPESGNPAPFGANTWLSANGIHALDALVFMMNGLPEYVTALTGEAEVTAPAAFSALMRWPDGAQGAFLCNNNAGARREEYIFHGLGETCRVDEQGLLIEKGSHKQRIVSHSLAQSITAEHESFVGAIRENVEPLHGIGRIAASLFLCELIERGFSGPVRLPEPEPEANRASAYRPGAPTILVEHSGELLAAITKHLPDARLLSSADVLALDGARPDVVAGILGSGAQPLHTGLLEKLPCLRIVGVAALSLARHDPQMLLARGISVLNATQSYAESVAEFALGLAILGRRRAFISHEVMRHGGWGFIPPSGLAGFCIRGARRLRPLLEAAGLKPLLLRLREISGHRTPGGGALQPRELRGATVGLVGWSANASAFARRLQIAQARVLCYSEHGSDADISAAGVTRVSLAAALAADVVSLHRGLTPLTRHFLGAPELEKIRGGAVLINIARGALIEPRALLARLQRGDLIACLDTFEAEPLKAQDPLRRLPNVFLTSHIAGGSADMRAAAADEVVRKVASYLAGNQVASLSAERLRTMT